MRALLFVALVSLIPLSASATTTLEGCHADLVCAQESSFGADCNDFAAGSTLVSVGGALFVGGAYECYPGGGSRSVSASAGAASVYWGEFHYSDPENGDFQSCFVFVGPSYLALPCDPAAPPNPGWGNVLP